MYEMYKKEVASETEVPDEQNLDNENEDLELIVNSKRIKQQQQPPKEKICFFNNADHATGMNDDLLPLNSVKTSCWNCFCIMDKETGISTLLMKGKHFCSILCKDQFQVKYYVMIIFIQANCSFEECPNLVDKELGLYSQGRIFCKLHYKEEINISNTSQKIDQRFVEGEDLTESPKDSEEDMLYDPMLDF
jgi:hypothetical protein